MDMWLGFPAVEEYQGLKLNELPLNHAYIIANTTVDNVGVYGVRNDCFNCPYKLEKYLRAGEKASWMVDTSGQRLWRIMITEPMNYVARNNRRGILCQMRPTLHEYGVYSLDVGRCKLTTEVAPAHSYLPLLISSLLLLSLSIIYGLVMMCRRKYKEAKKEKVAQINIENEESDLKNLHIYRDIIMYLLIFATTGGGGYPIFNIEWGGLSIGECLFFAFAWTVGVNIPTVMDEALNRQGKCSIVRDIFKRAFVLIFLGTVMDSTVDCSLRLHNENLWCPLQRLGVAYFIVASAYVMTVQKFEMKSKRTICKAIGNLVSLMWCWILAGFILALIVILMSTFMSFNCLSDAPLEQQPDYSKIVPEVTLNCNNDSSEFANKIFVAEARKVVNVNGFMGFGRGVMGVMSTIMYTLIGLKAGIVYLHYQSNTDRLKLWWFWATLFGLGAAILAAVSYPLNFNLWPISTILFISTLSFYTFIISSMLVDILKLDSFFLPSGVASSVSLAILCGHQLFSNSLPFTWNIVFRSHLMYLFQNFWILFLWFLIASILKKKKVKFQI